MKLAPTYKRDLNGGIRMHVIEVEGNKYRMESGLIDGARVTSEWTEVHGKNQGRSNETSDEEQALKVANRIRQIRLEQGDYDNIEDIDKGKRFFQPMLASKYDAVESKIVDLKSDTFKTPGCSVFVQRKLDGCVSGDMLISTDCGDLTMKDIVENGQGNSVWSYNLKTRKRELKPILNRFKDIPDIQEDRRPWYLIRLTNGTTLKLTGNHMVYLPVLRCWRRVDSLKVGDKVLSI